MVKSFEQPQPLVERKFESGHRGQLGPNQQTLAGRAAMDVADEQSFSQSVPEYEIV
jgi:hypothetical protein